MILKKIKIFIYRSKNENYDIYRSKNDFWKISYIGQYSISYIGQYTTILILTDIWLHISLIFVAIFTEILPRFRNKFGITYTDIRIFVDFVLFAIIRSSFAAWPMLYESCLIQIVRKTRFLQNLFVARQTYDSIHFESLTLSKLIDEFFRRR